MANNIPFAGYVNSPCLFEVDFFPSEINMGNSANSIPMYTISNSDMLLLPQHKKFTYDYTFYNTDNFYFYKFINNISFLILRGRNLKNHLYVKIDFRINSVNTLTEIIQSVSCKYKILKYDGKTMYIKILFPFDRFNAPKFLDNLKSRSEQFINLDKKFYMSYADCVEICKTLSSLIIQLDETNNVN